MNQKPLSDEEIRNQLKKLNRPDPPQELWSRIAAGLDKERANRRSGLVMKIVSLSQKPAFMISSAAAILIAVLFGLYVLPAEFWNRKGTHLAETRIEEKEPEQKPLSEQIEKATDQVNSSDVVILAKEVKHQLNAAFSKPKTKRNEDISGLPDSIRLNLASMADMEFFVEQNRAKLDPHYYAVTREKLSLLDRSIKECREALSMNALNSTVNRFLDRSAKEKLKTLQSLVDYIKDPKNENKH